MQSVGAILPPPAMPEPAAPAGAGAGAGAGAPTSDTGANADTGDVPPPTMSVTRMVSLSQMLDLDDDDGDQAHIDRAKDELVRGLMGSRAESLRILAGSHTSGSSRRRNRKPRLDTMSELAELLDDDDVEVEGDADDDHM